MSVVESSEIIPGLVVHCSPSDLVSHGGCQTIAAPEKECKGKPHFFLVLVRDYQGLGSLCVPLYSEKDRIAPSSYDWVSLDPGLKSGKPEDWTDGVSYFFKWQFWLIPVTAFSNASRDDTSDSSCRRFYSEDANVGLEEIIKYLAKKRLDWRSLS